MTSLPARLPASAPNIHRASAMALLSIQRSRFRPRCAVASAAFGFALLLSSVAGLQAQQTIAEPQDAGSVRETSPAQLRSISHSSGSAEAGAFERSLDPAAVSVGRTATDFGEVKAGELARPAVVTFTFRRSATLGSIDVVTKGARDLDFADAHTGTCKAGASYSAGSTCTVHATFKPRVAGARHGAVQLKDESGETIAVHPMFGSGHAAEVVYEPGTLTTLESSLGAPVALALDGNGNIYVTDEGLLSLPPAVYELAPGGGSILKTIGSGWSKPSAIAVDGSGNVYVADSDQGAVYKETPSGNSYTQSLVGNGFINPDGVAIDGIGHIFVSDYGGVFDINFPPPVGSVYLITNMGGNASTQTLLGQPFSPSGAAVDAQGDLFVGAQVLHQWPPAGVFEFSSQAGSPTGYSAPNLLYRAFSTISDVALDPAGDIYVTDNNLNNGSNLGGVFKLTPSSSGYTLSTIFDVSVFSRPQGLAFDAGGDLYISARSEDQYDDTTTSLNFVDYADAPTLTFPNTLVGSPDPPQTVTIANIGNSALSFAIPPAGVNPSISAGYLLDTASEGVCPSVHSNASSPGMLLPATSCNLTVTFDPLALGNDPGMLVMTDNNLLAPGLSGAVQTIQLAGVEVGPTTNLRISAPGSVGVNQAFNFTVTAVDSMGNITPAYAGTVHFSSSDSAAMLPADTTLNNGTATLSATLLTPGPQTIVDSDTGGSGIVGSTANITVEASNLVVTTNQDDAGNAANCTSQTAPGTGADASCSLRDALLEATALGGGEITFDSVKFSATNSAALNTITLGSAGPLILPSSTAIVGPTTGSGPNLKNLVKVSGNNTTSIFSVSNSAVAVNLSNLTIANGLGALANAGNMQVEECAFTGNSGGSGAAIYNNGGNLSVANSIFSGNSAPGQSGGAINNNGVLTVAGSTFSGNSASIGGAIYSVEFSSLTLTNSTLSGNTASQSSGAIFAEPGASLTINDSTISGNSTPNTGFAAGIGANQLALSNSIVSANGSNPSWNIIGPYTDNGGNQVGAAVINLAPLGSYGGFTQTMPPLPGSPAVCGGVLGNALAIPIATDQRGLSFDPLCPSGQIDSGAVQANYALAFTRQPPASAVAGAALSPAPIVGLTESGAAATAATTSVAMTDSASLLGGTDAVNLAAGSANFTNLVISTATSNDILTATLKLSPSISLTAHAGTGVTVAPAPAAMASPVPGSVLTGQAVTFSWSAVSGATAYQVWIGSTGVNTNNVYSSGAITATSVMPLNLPLNGEKLYVRLYTEITGTWYHNDYTYTAAAPATLSAPAAGSTLPGPVTTFTWTAPAGAGAYQLWLGTTGVNSNNLFSSGLTHANSTTRTTMPTNGQTIYARLFTDFNGAWISVYYTFTAANQSAPVSPAVGATLAGLVQTFTWTTASGSSVGAYQFWIGSTGVGSNDVYSSGILHTTTVTRTNMPTNGETLYARLFTDYNGAWVHQDYTLTAATMALTAPAQGSTLPGPVATFTWTAPAGASAYQLWLGSTGVNSNDLYSSGILHTNSVTRTTLPTAGGTIYARLYTDFSGTWTHVDYTFTAAKQAVIITPAPFTAVPGTVWQFHWSAATGNATQYQLWVGSAGVGSNNLYSSGAVTATTETVTLPSIGGTIYVRLYTNFNGTWVHTDWSNTEQ